MGVPLFIVDAFTPTPYGGNPAAVCLLDAPRDAAWMLRVAGEMNLSETAFLLARQGGYDLRWFTPAVEIDLCGHATLASAHVLWETGRLAADAAACFYTRSGLLAATRRGAAIELDFPARPAVPADAPPNLLAALGVTALYVGRNVDDYLIEVASEDVVRAIQPDLRLLRTVAARGIIVTAAALGADYDFVSRFFAPASGIDEDPVTGSAHCCLALYWAERLGRSRLRAWQASARGGALEVEAQGDRVALRGRATTVLRGELLADRAAD